MKFKKIASLFTSIQKFTVGNLKKVHLFRVTTKECYVVAVTTFLPVSAIKMDIMGT